MDRTTRQPDETGVPRTRDLLTAALLAIPSPPAWYVQRPRLLAMLDAADSLPLVLVSAPAGTGKTSLLADWVRTRGEPGRTGWITFEEDDGAIWSHVLQSLELLGVEVPARLFSDNAPALDRRLLTSLAAAVARHPSRLTLVLDGYEFVSHEGADDLDFLLRHSNRRLRVVIATRLDPLLPLYRYRLEESLVELRAADLAFTDAEASQLMKRSGVRLEDESVHALTARTKGWAAGLRFAAKTLARRPDPDSAVANVVAETGDIGEYLIGEVLEAQTPEVRQLLLNTSVPETLYPGLVEELAGRSAIRTVDILTKINAFVEPVSEHLGCYRYYPFFRDLLRAQLAYESPGLMVDLQRKAATWFEREGLLEAAVGHLAAIDAWQEAAAEVVDSLAIGQLLLESSAGPLTRVMRQIPGDVDRPAASVVRAALALAEGDPGRSEDELVEAREAGQDEPHSDDAVFLSLAVVEAVRSRFAEDPHQACMVADQAVHELEAPERKARTGRHPELAALAHLSQGIARFRLGRLAEARGAFTAGAEAAAASGYASMQAGCLGHVALVDAVEGRLSHAVRTAVESVAADDRAGTPVAERAPAAQVALAWVALEQYDLYAAREHVWIASHSDALSTETVSHVLLEVVKAGLQRARGHLSGASATLGEATAGVGGQDHWLADRLRLESAKAQAARGQAGLALRELESIGERDEPEVALVAAQAHIDQGHEAAAEAPLARASADEAPLGARVAGLLLEVAQESRRRSPDRARVALDRSLRLAATESLRRPFREAAPVVQRMLHADPRLAAQNEWLVGPPTGRPRTASIRPDSLHHRPDGAAPSVHVDKLTAKELEVLGHLAELLSTEEIAGAMFVSRNTVRTHIRSILRKLGVTRRNAAVRRARDLGLLDV